MENQKNNGRVALILGILSLVLALSLSRIAGFILGIFAITNGAKLKDEDAEAKTGWILGIVGAIVSGSVLLLIVPCIFVFFLSMSV